MRPLKLLALTVAFLGLAGLASAQVGIIVTTINRVSLRVGPGTNFERIAILDVGTPVALDGRNSDGVWVRGITSSGQVGWLAVQFTRGASRDAVLALPQIAPDAPISVAAPPGAPAPVASAGGNPSPAAPAGRSAVRGFSYGGHVAGLDDFAVEQMRRAGMTWVKKQVRYQFGMDANGFAGMINDVHARGFRILIGLVGERDQLYQAGFFDQYAAFAAGLAALGADAIEVWNEPNIDREWPAGQINGARYTELLAVTYNAIKARNPNTLVISGAPAPTGFFGGGCAESGCDDAPFLRQMAQAGAARYMDCVGVHYNEGILPPTATSGDPRTPFYTRYYRGMVDVYYNAFNRSRPLCFTELGYLSPEGYGPLPPAFGWAANVTVAQQAAWLDQVVDMARRSGIVRVLIIWNVNYTGYGDDPQAGYAIIRPGGICPACDALGR
ncbi:MAG: SH3 domain-containing protein [Anaerolineae bacterium]|nr:SH3 domain-containing protein [Anaerolineae bacterium]MDW8173415.1 SH3 domain-containing protein [Anaerolineae bacterium]